MFKSRKGFTLIEFIIVMAIIGILVLMAAPKFLDYVEKAKATQIKNDIKVLQNVVQAKTADALAEGKSEADIFTEEGAEQKELLDVSFEEKELKLKEVDTDKLGISSKTGLSFYADKDGQVYVEKEEVNGMIPNVIKSLTSETDPKED